ncbi:MAG: cadherin repeat domain-containing protein, partial [Luminiphilus sp.]
MKGPLSHHLPGVFSVIFLSACGGGGGGTNLETSPSLNNAPEFVGVMEYSVDENTTGVTTVEATDPDGDAVTYSLSGSDANAFSVGSTSGMLAFVDPPNYEAPADSDADNVYEITVSASDGTASASLGLVITVADLAGDKMVLMGNSFFRPYAEHFGVMAADAGFFDHSDTGVFAGG